MDSKPQYPVALLALMLSFSIGSPALSQENGEGDANTSEASESDGAAEETTQPDYEESLAGLRNATRDGNWGEALRIANLIRHEREGEPEFDQYYGIALINTGDAAAAVYPLERVLLSEPDAGRVRLELGRAYFELERWEDARNQFQRVLASEPPENVQANINRFLTAIDEAEREANRTWSGSFSVGAAYNAQFAEGETLVVSGFSSEPEDRQVTQLSGQIDIQRERRRSNFLSTGFGARVQTVYADPDNDDPEVTPDVFLRYFRTYEEGTRSNRYQIEVGWDQQSISGSADWGWIPTQVVRLNLNVNPSLALNTSTTPRLRGRVVPSIDVATGRLQHRLQASFTQNYHLKTGSSSENSDAEAEDLYRFGARYRAQFSLTPQLSTGLEPSWTQITYTGDQPNTDGQYNEDRVETQYGISGFVTWLPQSWLYTRGSLGYTDLSSTHSYYDNSGLTAQFSAALLW